MSVSYLFMVLLIFVLFLIMIFSEIAEIQLRNSLYKHFPGEATRILGKQKTFLGLYVDLTLSHLNSEEFKRLTKRIDDLEKKRKIIIWCFYLMLLLFIPFVILIIVSE